jgi:F-type H+-transporting ATPase subunit a
VTFALQQMFPEHLVVSLLTALCIGIAALLLTRDLKRIPDRKQAAVELIYSALDNFVANLIGPTYKRYMPLVGTAFIYILVMNLAGLIPGWVSPTANLNVTAGLALVVVVFVQYEGIRVNGLKGYLMHFVGEPLWLAPLNFPLHLIGEAARLLSLSIRLFGNIFGEDVVIVILIALGGLVPTSAPMYFFAVFTSFVQAMVFSILMCVYIALMTVHEDHGHQHEHGHDEGHGHAHDTPVPRPAV